MVFVWCFIPVNFWGWNKKKALKAKQYSCFCISVKPCKSFSNNYACVKSALQKWVTSNPNIMHYLISNDLIQIKVYYGNVWTNTELFQIYILQVSVSELHMDMISKYSTGFQWYIKKGVSHISDHALWLILPPILHKMTQHHQHYVWL